MNNKWKLCSEVLPKQDGTYLTTIKCTPYHNILMILQYTHDLYGISKYDFDFLKNKKKRQGWYNYDSEYGCYKVDNVIAWTELPAAYEEVASM